MIIPINITEKSICTSYLFTTNFCLNDYKRKTLSTLQKHCKTGLSNKLALFTIQCKLSENESI